jgi:hypothetical protein
MVQIIPAADRDQHLREVIQMLTHSVGARECIEHACQEWSYSLTLARALVESAKVEILNDQDIDRSYAMALHLAQAEASEVFHRRAGNMEEARRWFEIKAKLARTLG